MLEITTSVIDPSVKSFSQCNENYGKTGCYWGEKRCILAGTTSVQTQARPFTQTLSAR